MRVLLTDFASFGRYWWLLHAYKPQRRGQVNVLPGYVSIEGDAVLATYYLVTFRYLPPVLRRHKLAYLRCASPLSMSA